MKSAAEEWKSIEYLALSRMRMMLLERLRRGHVTDADLLFVSRVVQPLVYPNRKEMAQALNLSPRSLSRIFGDARRAGPQLRLDMLEAYLRGVETRLKAPHRAP